ncbi:M20 family metallopeptidase [Gulosibacter sp. 10]|uniref:M20 family metallopeptidase n=1 Tax=Gulosibacter sp. 10 TaxID=1255570 RepID=UPI00097F3640|nr:M20/M25/M40 family metallo-hydrolase [Gulosibacter sp. 10]SJM64633.1 Acetylornithine deacetylase [Gulosibacter sp. 10]
MTVGAGIGTAPKGGRVTAIDSRRADPDRVLGRLHAEAIAALAADLIRAESENPGGTEVEAVRVLADALRVIGAEVTLDYVDTNRPNLVARLGARRDSGHLRSPREGDAGILFLGHSDVVPAGEGWTGDPYEPRREGDLLIGRGATDMKGGLAAVVAAMAAVHAEAPELPMTLVCTVDEEVDARGSLHYIRHFAPASYTACIVAEPTGLATITACRGASNLRVSVSGASAHAGNPADGVSAILAAADLIAEVEADDARLAQAPHPVLGAACWNVGTIEGGHGTSIVPDRCVLSIDRRTLPGEEPGRILADLLERARERIARRARPGAERIRLDGEVEMTMPGFCTDPDAPLVLAACEAVCEAGGEARTGVWSAACEGGFMAEHHKVPTIVLGPGDIAGQAHQPDETVSVHELHTAARAYALLALRLGDPGRDATPD